VRWLENPYYQYFCGELSFCHKLPFDRSSMTHWRQRLCEEQLVALGKSCADHSRRCGRPLVVRARWYGRPYQHFRHTCGHSRGAAGFPASPGARSDTDRHRGWLRSNFVARERQEDDYRPITPSIQGMSVTRISFSTSNPCAARVRATRVKSQILGQWKRKSTVRQIGLNDRPIGRSGLAPDVS
jgi:hypothetical protein